MNLILDYKLPKAKDGSNHPNVWQLQPAKQNMFHKALKVRKIFHNECNTTDKPAYFCYRPVQIVSDAIICIYLGILLCISCICIYLGILIIYKLKTNSLIPFPLR